MRKIILAPTSISYALAINALNPIRIHLIDSLLALESHARIDELIIKHASARYRIIAKAVYVHPERTSSAFEDEHILYVVDISIRQDTKKNRSLASNLKSPRSSKARSGD